jgi:hypothetical protein
MRRGEGADDDPEPDRRRRRAPGALAAPASRPRSPRRSTRRSAQIRPDNVARLELAWTYRTGEPLVALAGGGRPPAFEATPVYAFGLLYIGTPYGKVDRDSSRRPARNAGPSTRRSRATRASATSRTAE